MDKTVAIEVAKLRDLYQRGDKKTRSILEGIYGKDVLIPGDEEIWEQVKQRLLNNEQPNGAEVDAVIAYVDRLRCQAKPAENKLAPWPIKDEAGKVIGVGVPVINKAFYFADVPDGDKGMSWDDAMEYAKKRGRTLASKAELMVCYYFKDAINKIAEEAGFPELLDDWTWSSTEYSANGAWYVYFNSGYVGNGTKYTTTFVVRPAAAL